MSSRYLFPRVACTVLLIVATACGGGGGGDDSQPKSSAAGPARQCANKIPFTAAYLPSGFSKTLQAGPGGGRPGIKNVTVFHYNGSGGRFIDIFRGGGRAEIGRSSPIKVLARFGRIAPIPRGYAIRFRLRTAVCSRYQLELIGLGSGDAVKVGHGLRPTTGG